MKDNVVKQKIARGETSYGVVLSWNSPELLEFFGHLGFEWTFIDAEHGPIGRETCADLVRASRVSGLMPLVRVPENNAALILGYLDAGAMGIVVPHTRNASEAQAAVNAVRYSPLGARGAGSSSATANYGLTQTAEEYFAWANDNILLDINVEDVEGIENLDEILAVEGVDVVGIGSGDLAMSMRHHDQLKDPDVQQLTQEAEARIAASGKVLDAVVGDAASAHKAVRQGARLVAVKITGLLAKAGREVLVEEQ